MVVAWRDLAFTILGGSFLVGLVALLKLGPEREHLTVESAQTAVESMQMVLEHYTRELENLRPCWDQLEEAKTEARRWRNAYVELSEKHGC